MLRLLAEASVAARGGRATGLAEVAPETLNSKDPKP